MAVIGELCDEAVHAAQCKTGARCVQTVRDTAIKNSQYYYSRWGTRRGSVVILKLFIAFLEGSLRKLDG